VQIRARTVNETHWALESSPSGGELIVLEGSKWYVIILDRDLGKQYVYLPDGTLVGEIPAYTHVESSTDTHYYIQINSPRYSWAHVKTYVDWIGVLEARP